jgi:hypothetical protein
LRRWAPRQPSPELRRRIFRQVAAPEASPRNLVADFSQWLVPAFGCFLLVAGTLTSRYPAHAVLPIGATNFLSAETGNGYTEMVIASGADHSDKNSLPAPRLEWTFGGRSSAANPAARAGVGLVSYTNQIIQ